MKTKKKARKPQQITARWCEPNAADMKETVDTLAGMMAIVTAQTDATNLTIIRLILADKKLDAIELLLKPMEQPKVRGVWKAVHEGAK